MDSRACVFSKIWPCRGEQQNNFRFPPLHSSSQHLWIKPTAFYLLLYYRFTKLMRFKEINHENVVKDMKTQTLNPDRTSCVIYHPPPLDGDVGHTWTPFSPGKISIMSSNTFKNGERKKIKKRNLCRANVFSFFCFRGKKAETSVKVV